MSERTPQDVLREALPCSRCGGPHQFDTSIASPLWNRVVREAGWPDFLCTTCIVLIFVRAGESFGAELYGDAVNLPDRDVPTISVRVGTRPIDESYGSLQAELRETLDKAIAEAPDTLSEKPELDVGRLIEAWTRHRNEEAGNEHDCLPDHECPGWIAAEYARLGSTDSEDRAKDDP